MGDRGNIVVKVNGKPDLFLYTHWAGSDLPETLRAALKRGESRWDDAQYLSRIIFCEMVRDDIDGDRGFGISTFMGDGGTEIYVDASKQTVTYKDRTKSFAEYVSEPEPREKDDEDD